jgi:CRP/FNR family transcriptional regulator, cyclic AMP receptor protein
MDAIDAGRRGAARRGPGATRGRTPAERAAGVRVFDRDPDLLAGIDPRAAELLRRRVVVAQLRPGRGSWCPPRAGRAPVDAVGLLVLDGLMVRSICPHGRDCPELLGPGDLLRPWDAGATAAERSAWRVLKPATIAVLDARFAAVVARWPSILGVLLTRSSVRSRALALHLAISDIRQAETRLLMLLWHLADRWGRPAPDGIDLPLPLTHEVLGQLVRLHRPTASTALRRLTVAGEIARRPDRGWTLLGEPPAQRVPGAARLPLAA